MLKKFVLVLNCGSSSLKCSIINIANKKVLISIVAERLFLENSEIKWTFNNELKYKKVFLTSINHSEALIFILTRIKLKYKKILMNIVGVGHRVVHGGYKLRNSMIVNDKIISLIKKSSIFAPLHNPLNIIGIKVIIKFFPHLSQKNVVVFDTSFHNSIPKIAYLYAIPYTFYKKYNIRRYGAHGISHNYVALKSAKILKKSIKKLNIISCHLGNGSSVTAIKNGKSIDTSMGLTPLEGLVMGTRSGDLDPSIIFFLYSNLGLKIKNIKKILMKKSGFLGISKKYSDCRELEKSYLTNKYSKLAIDIFVHRLAKYISSYTSLMENRLDAIVFTGGIGENSSLIRKLVIKKLGLIGFYLEKSLNKSNFIKKNYFLHTSMSKPILVIPTNEELFIAKETIKLLNI
ncbi:acetate kinase [Buchnera aphidicola]|uniref:acetate kinase n=1 Tax=Buchnera aphidicola TaxID=9 RepID=UPI0030ECE776